MRHVFVFVARPASRANRRPSRSLRASTAANYNADRFKRTEWDTINKNVRTIRTIQMEILT